MEEFIDNSIEEMAELSNEHFDSIVMDTIYGEVEEMIYDQIASDSRVIMLTATNRVLAQPLATYLGVEDLIATNLETVDNKYTGEIVDTYCYGEGKLERMLLWCNENDVDSKDVSYYGDSWSDRFVLEHVKRPHVVNPVKALRDLAKEKNWGITDYKIES
ncbi:MAG: HAD-IB family phosphatase [Lentisphaeria bacterium]|nr:HAD-IB family phosphatase [Lentisphaeria bacterium]NQZ68473.1 HAD-IB family phosphatase [Lentisphaeria bacterium]